MSEDNNELEIQTASVSDRGLSEKRPLNEDSFLADSTRRIFAVADGVGGAQAGEVASQTAMEVLDEAFRHQTKDADIEDLMEIAIQRANASINRMAHEHPKLSMMATTIVALHLDGHTATIGHVGDSRLYRLAADGTLHRETQDHSVVEEEVRAGRMTPDQAANHPSRNVISRALGAEETVEVDLKTMEVEDGTAFLLCSDGITRHIKDDEIRELLSSSSTLEEICGEMKRRCYARGAEDNLTAIVIRVGSHVHFAATDPLDDERTISIPRVEPAGAGVVGASNQQPVAQGLSPASRTAFQSQVPPVNSDYTPPIASVAGQPVSAPAGMKNSAGGRVAWVLFTLIFIGGAAAAGYLAGKFRTQQEMQARLDSVQAVATPTATPIDPETAFDQQRRAVDAAPQSTWKQMSLESGGKPLDSTDPQFLYLYGRALLLSGKAVEASEAFKKAVDVLKVRPARDPLKVDAKLSNAVAALRTGNWQAAQTASKQIEEVIQQDQNTASNQSSPAAR